VHNRVTVAWLQGDADPPHYDMSLCDFSWAIMRVGYVPYSHIPQ